MAKYLIQWSTEAWHEQIVEAENEEEAEEAWNPDLPYDTYQENITGKWWNVELIEDEDA